MSFNRVITPDRHEDQTVEAQTGGIVGWLPGIITAIEPAAYGESLGRIRCKSDLISPGQNLPNSWDGYVWVLADFVVNGEQGGSHRPLQVGTQVALLPMMGDPTQLLMLGCLHSRSDRPNPLFDRSKQVHGSQSAGQTFKILNDKEGSRHDAYPTGVIHASTANGSAVSQTAGGARTALQKDGTATIENPKSSTSHDSQGTVTARSAGGAISTLNADGTVRVLSEKLGAELLLNKDGSQLFGVAPKLTQLLTQASELIGGRIGEATALFKKLGTIGQMIGAGEDVTAFAKNAEKILANLDKDFGSVIEQAQAVLSDIDKFSVSDLGALIMPQVEKAIGMNLSDLRSKILPVVNDFEALNTTLKTEGIKTIPESEKGTIERLGYSPKLQSEFVIGLINPEGYLSTSNLSGLGLDENIVKISEWSEKWAIGVNPETSDKPPAISELMKLIPEELKSIIPKDFAKIIETEFDPNKIIETLMGSVSKELLSKGIESVDRIAPMLSVVSQVQNLTTAFIQKDPNLTTIAAELGKIPGLEMMKGLENIKNPEQLISTAMDRFSQSGLPDLKSAIGDIGKLAHAIPSLGPRSKLEITDSIAKLSSKGGAHSIFADEGGAGMRTPWGGFGFGSGGGLMETLGPLAMQAIGPMGGGLTLDPKLGAMLTGAQSVLNPAQAAVKVSGDVIHLGNPQKPGSGLTVTPQGVMIEGFQLSALFDRITTLENLVQSLQSNSNSSP
jgi:hypothetical protein